MPSCVTDVAPSEQSTLQLFVDRAAGRLSGIRNGILIYDQDPTSQGDIDISLINLRLLSREAAEAGFGQLVALAGDCEVALQPLLSAALPSSASSIGHILDLVAQLEQAILTIQLDSADFPDDIGGFVDLSFDSITNEMAQAPSEDADFDIDDETLEIFAAEARELLDGISRSLARLSSDRDDRDALWEIRRNSHTLKGAAGIVGLTSASALAHRIEDLLDKVVDAKSTVSPAMISLLQRSATFLESLTSGRNDVVRSPAPDDIYDELKTLIDAVEESKRTDETSFPPVVVASQVRAPKQPIELTKPAATSVVRVSLDRLDELIKMSRSLAINRAAIADRFKALAGYIGIDQDRGLLEKLAALFDVQHRLTDELQDKLFGIRMVRFGMLETRLSRAVQITGQDEGKRIFVEVVNGDHEVDTQIIDAMIEPLLHLLKNAAVHGIEAEDTRRLVGKPERGTVRISIDSDESAVSVVVEDDGRGISTQKLKARALIAGIISNETASEMSDQDAFALMFHRGVTTAEKLDLNAGRGIGMSIVKESIESHGGTVSVVSKPQVGTAFTIRMPQLFKRSNVVIEHGADGTGTSDALTSITPDNKTLNVLIVDDSSSIRLITSGLIESAGWKPVVAKDGLDALEILSSLSALPDVILTDLEMPRMDGYEFLAALKEDEKFKQIPVIMITSRTEDEYRDMAFELGVSDFVSKPYSEEGLLKSIKKLCQF